MTKTLTLIALTLALGGAHADSTSSASSAASNSVGSISNSIGKSSDSSSGKTDVMAGDYRIRQVAAAPGKPGLVRVDLAGAAPQLADQALWLDLPVATAQGLQAGQVLTVAARPYGLAFSHAGAAEPFFLALQATAPLDPVKL